MKPSAILPRNPMETLRPSSVLAMILLFGVAVLATGCTGYTNRLVLNPAPAAARLRAGGQLQAEVDCLAQPLITNNEVFSMAVGVLTSDGAIHNYSYGGAPRPGPDTLFEIGSVAKVFVASLVTLLVEEGRLRYEETVRELLPPDVQVSAEVGRLTVYQLVTHTSGLPRQPENLAQMRYFMDYVFLGRNPYSFITRPYLYRYLRTCRAQPDPEQPYYYSNLGYGLLGHLIELKTGRSLPELVEEKICRPLNMRDTHFTLTESQRKRLATGHVGDQPKFIRRNTPMADWDMGEIMRASGGMYSTVNDLMIFARSNLGLLGHPLDARLAPTHQVQIRTPTEDITTGWVINHYAEWNTSITYMNGIIAGYSAYIGMDTGRNIAVVVLSSNFNWTDKVGQNLVLRLGAAANQPPVAAALKVEAGKADGL